MTRPDGFARADISTSLAADPKFRKLARTLDEPGMHAAFTLYVSVILESWWTGRPVPASDAAPVWMHDVAPTVQALQGVGLLTSREMIPDGVWSAWFGPVAAKRAALRSAGRLGADRRYGSTESSPPHGPATATPSPPHSQAIGYGEGGGIGRLGEGGAGGGVPLPAEERSEAVRTNQAILDDPRAPEPSKRAALHTLRRLGAWGSEDPEEPPVVAPGQAPLFEEGS
jgi:hypothetical protein